MMIFCLKAMLIMTETRAEESFRRNRIFTALDLIISDLANCLETHTNICDLVSPVLNYRSLAKSV